MIKKLLELGLSFWITFLAAIILLLKKR